jgi:hypothetical protein
MTILPAADAGVRLHDRFSTELMLTGPGKRGAFLLSPMESSHPTDDTGLSSQPFRRGRS